MKINRTLSRWCLPALVTLSLCTPVPIVYAASIDTGFSPEGTALRLVLKTIATARQEIRLMGYSFTSPEVVRPVRTVSAYKIMHDKVIVADGRNTESGSFNFSRAADRSNSENVLVVWDDPTVAQRYLQHWQSRWDVGTDWRSSY